MTKEKRIKYLEHLVEWSSGKDLEEVEQEYEKFKEEFPEMLGICTLKPLKIKDSFAVFLADFKASRD